MRCSKVIVAVVAAALALAVGMITAATASAQPTVVPMARFNATCGGLGPCLVFSRGETEGMANGEQTTAVGMISPACALAGPFAALCALAAADVGPGMTIASKAARKTGKCAALQFDGNPIQPSASKVRPTSFRCPN